MKSILLAVVVWVTGILGLVADNTHWVLSHIPKPAHYATSEPAAEPTASLPSAQSRIATQPPPLATTTTRVAATTTVVTQSAQSAAAPAPEPYTAEFAATLEEAIHEKINEQRAQNHLESLTYDYSLRNVARFHSTDMAQQNYFAHEDNKGCDIACRLDQIKYNWLWAGENIFLLKSKYRYSVGDAASIIVAGWMGSEGHRANILDWHFQNEGIGVTILGNSIYATEDFSNPK